MYHVDVAVAAALPGSFTYVSGEKLAPGQRILVPFGRSNRQIGGVVLDCRQPAAGEKVRGLKPVRRRIDREPVFSEELLRLARWMTAYYLTPLGEVLRTMLPPGISAAPEGKVELSEAGLEERQDSGAGGRLLRELFPRRQARLEKGIEQRLAQIREENPLEQHDLEALLEKGWLQRCDEQGQGHEPDGEQGEIADDAFASLTPAQNRVMTDILDQDDKPPFRPDLLCGVTGSGKTEIYCHLIRHLFREGPPGVQVLMMVPEISLTPQMTRFFAARFPGMVRVVHSMLSDQERWRHLDSIRRGQSRILIGPRSAVFAPFANLGLILVDEEHDASYKQTSGMTYNGRDVGVMRGRLGNARVVLGSATPSLESWNNAARGRYRLHELPERVSGRPLPEISVFALDAAGGGRNVKTEGGVPALPTADLRVHGEIIRALQENLAAGYQSMVIVNRRGYASYLYSEKEEKAVSCPRCSISLTLHKKRRSLRCHYCDYSCTLQQLQRRQPGDRFCMVGYGSQQAEEYLVAVLPDARIRRLDSDTMTNKKVLPGTLGAFGRGEIDILVGTQVLAKGHDFPGVTLIVILGADQSLDLPDFRAGERTFQLMVQAAGRAGRGAIPGKVMVQTMRPRHPVIRRGLAQDFIGFAGEEVEMRRRLNYPPFTRMIVFEWTSTSSARLASLAGDLSHWLQEQRDEAFAGVDILGPAIPSVEQIRGRWRRSLMLTSNKPEMLWDVAGRIRAAFSRLSGDLRLLVNVDPQNLL